MPGVSSYLYGISVSELARICHVDLATARRWKRGATCPPKTALLILARDLGCFSEFWRGWTVNGEDLVSPDGWCVNRNDALIVPLMHSQISALRAEIRALKDEAAGMDEQPLPGEVSTQITA
jgi:hypothetical protein